MNDHELSVLPLHEQRIICKAPKPTASAPDETGLIDPSESLSPLVQASGQDNSLLATGTTGQILGSTPISTSAASTSNLNSASIPASASTSTSASDAQQQDPLERTSTEQYPATPPPGYPMLADCIERMPQVAIFRRFTAINTLDLLYRQAEIVQMEERLYKLQQKDAATSDSTREYARDWFFLSDSASDGNSAQWDHVQKLRVKLKEYNEAVALQMTIARAEFPSKHDLHWLQEFLLSDEMGLPLVGADRHAWGNPYLNPPVDLAPDLFSLLPPRNEDLFSRWISDHVLRRILNQSKWCKPLTRRGVVGFEADQVLRWTFAFSTAVASALPVASVAILYSVQSQKLRLTLMAAFNVTLAFTVALLASPRIIDTFTASFAFSAINVIWFSSSNDTNLA